MREDSAKAALYAVHDASLFPAHWPAALEAIAAACEADFALVQVVGDGDTDVFATPTAQALAGDYVAAGWHLGNPRMERGMQLTRQGHRGLVTEWHGFSPEELARQPFQQEFALPKGLDHEAAAILATEGETRIIMSLVRKSEAFEGRALADANRLVAHIADAFKVALRLKFASARALTNTVDSHTEGAAILSGSGRVLHATRKFLEYVPTVFALKGGRLTASSAADGRRLEIEIRAAATGAKTFGAPKPVALRRKERLPLIVHCSPIAGAASDFLSLGKVLVTLDDPDLEVASDGAMLARNFALTPAEARLAVLIGAGIAPVEAAKREHVTVETIRKRLKVLFAKTGTHRQSELAVMVSHLTREWDAGQLLAGDS